MEVIVAKTAGFCFGVEQAVQQVYKQINVSTKPVYTYGPIIHNEEVVRDLENKGVEVIHTLDELKTKEKGIVVIRSHGIGRQIQEEIASYGMEIVDATCPFVKKIHRLVSKNEALGYGICIIGNQNHPEVEGIVGWTKNGGFVIESEEEVEKIPFSKNEKLCIVSQTTFNYNKFKYLVEKIAKKGYDIIVLNTICNATQERQVEAKEIASKVDTMLVVGGKNSSNTQKLFEICKQECENTYFIQTQDDFESKWMDSAISVGITAGASTPNQIIEEVHTNVRIKF